MSAAGTPPLSYQWQRRVGVDYVDIAGATSNTLVLPDVTLADDHARFRVVVTNDFGSATSDVVMLDVTTDTPPTPTITLPSSGSRLTAPATRFNSPGKQRISKTACSRPRRSPGRSIFTTPRTSTRSSRPLPASPAGSSPFPPTAKRRRTCFTASGSSLPIPPDSVTESFRDIRPETSEFLVTNNLGGGNVLVDGQTKQSPYAVTGVVNVQRTLEAPLTQAFGGTVGLFRQWLDGETSRLRTVATPEDDTAYVALYDDVSSSLTFLSDLTPSNVPPPNGWGPYELDTSNGEAAAGDGVPMQIGGVGYERGLGVHAFSDVRYTLGGAYIRFLADIGLDDETGAGGSVVFEVFGDNVSLFNSGTLTGNQGRVTVDVNIAGVNELRLVVTNAGDGDGLDHANWANARLIPQQAGSDIRINFQLDSAATPAGYLEDAGFVFDNRGNGYSYGWSNDHTDVSRDRNNNADQRLDTVIQFHVGQTWEIACRTAPMLSPP